MYKKSLLMVFAILTLVITSAFTTQMMLSRSLPSSFDPGISIEKAFQTSQHPLLVEFYSDTCSTCKKVTPTLHDLYQQKYKQKLTLVMINTDDPDNQQYSNIFGVEELPAIYVFDFKHMKKHPIALSAFESSDKLESTLDHVL